MTSDRQATQQLILLNLGTPSAPTTRAVRTYLSEFLTDPRVVPLPWIARQLLVRGIIAPLRSFASAKRYAKVFREDGSPLLSYSKALAPKVASRLGPQWAVDVAMRYGEPALPDVLREVKRRRPERIVLLPLFPQYASATTGSAFDLASKTLAKWHDMTAVTTIDSFCNVPGFVRAFAARGRAVDAASHDHVLFSFHGLPVNATCGEAGKSACKARDCQNVYGRHNRLCYKASCYETARRIAAELGLPSDRWTVSFQSRISSAWVRPFTDEVAVQLAQKGVARLAVYSPSFVTDCLETIEEIDIDLKEMFLQAGGKELTLVPSLNARDDWADVVADMARAAAPIAVSAADRIE